jgi:hypothetical protein
MDPDEPSTMTADEQLGSPAWTFERGMLLGIGLGVLMIVIVGRRRARRSGPAGGDPAP